MSDCVLHINGIEKDKAEEFDGIAFLQKGVMKKRNVEFDVWNVHFLKAPEKSINNFIEKADMGFLYTVCIRKTNKENQQEIQVFNAILGDPIYFVNNCMKAKEGGFIVKTSDWSKEVVERFMDIWGT